MPVAHVQRVPFWNELSPLTWKDHWGGTGPGALTNTGSGAYLYLQSSQREPSLAGGPLFGAYSLCRIDFHWGPDNQHGAHHLLGDSQCAMEIHASYYNSCYEYPQPKLLTLARPSWAIASVRFTEGAQNNAFQSIAQIVQNITEPGSWTNIKNLHLSWLRPARLDRDYLTYMGELEDRTRVTWIVYEKPNTLSKDQIDVFRTLLNSSGAPIIESRCKLPINPIKKEIVAVRDLKILQDHCHNADL